MFARSPAQVHELLARYLSAGDLDALASLYEPSAVLLFAPGEPVSGTAEIKKSLGGLVEMKGKFQISPGKVVAGTDLAVLFSNWTLEATDPSGNPVRLGGQTCDVVRRQVDGRWLFAIDIPTGAPDSTD